jgi:hypothetical protein
VQVGKDQRVVAMQIHMVSLAADCYGVINIASILVHEVTAVVTGISAGFAGQIREGHGFKPCHEEREYDEALAAEGRSLLQRCKLRALIRTAGGRAPVRITRRYSRNVDRPI